jgi:multidrug efflux pump subunit AcrA (membrane-fusion protein)
MTATLRQLRAHPWLAAVVTVLVIAGASAGGYFGLRGGSAGAAAPTTTTTTQTVGTGTVKQSVSASGTLAPADEKNLNFPVSGQVTSVAVEEGQTVRKGQTLATLDSAALSASVAQANASVTTDEAKVSDDATNDASATQFAADNAALAAAQHQLTVAKAQLADATMTSPIDGVVATVNLTAGQSVSGSNSSNSANSNSGSGSNSGAGSGAGAAASSGSGSSASSSSSNPQILVISTNSWLVNATVDDTSVGLIKTGDQAQLTVSGSTAMVYGTIASVGLISSSSTGTASYPVTIDVTGSPTGMHDGANVTASLIYKQVSNVVVIPTLALHRNSAGGQYVEKIVNGKSVQATVQVGLSSGGQTQIVSGLSSGDKITVPQLRAGRGSGARGATGTGGGEFPGGGEFGGRGGAGGFGGGRGGFGGRGGLGG